MIQRASQVFSVAGPVFRYFPYTFIIDGRQGSNKGSKNISIKMLKDVGMTVPKSRETSAVYMQQDNIYAAKQGMRACNNNNMRNPIIKEM